MDIEQVFAVLLLLGASAVITSIVAGGVKLFHFEVDHPLGTAQRWSLGVVGVLVAGGALAGLIWNRAYEPRNPPAPVGSTPSSPLPPSTPGPASSPSSTSASPSLPRADCSAPRVTISPRSGPPGTSVTVSGAGFPAGEAIRVGMYGESWDEPALAADDGTFTVTIRVTDHWGTFTPMESFVHATSLPQGCSAQTLFLITQR